MLLWSSFYKTVNIASITLHWKGAGNLCSSHFFVGLLNLFLSFIWASSRQQHVEFQCQKTAFHCWYLYSINHSVNKYLFTRFMIENIRNSVHTHGSSLFGEPIFLIITIVVWHTEGFRCVSHCANHLVLTAKLDK